MVWSKVFVSNEPITLGVALENSLNKGPGRVILLVRSIVKLVGSLGLFLLLSLSFLHILIFAFFFDRGQLGGLGIAESCWKLGDNLWFCCRDVFIFSLDHLLVFREVSSIECLQIEDPYLELSSKCFIAGCLPCKHRVARVLDQVNVAQARVLTSNKWRTRQLTCFAMTASNWSTSLMLL